MAITRNYASRQPPKEDTGVLKCKSKQSKSSQTTPTGTASIRRGAGPIHVSWIPDAIPALKSIRGLCRCIRPGQLSPRCSGCSGCLLGSWDAVHSQIPQNILPAMGLYRIRSNAHRLSDLPLGVGSCYRSRPPAATEGASPLRGSAPAALPVRGFGSSFAASCGWGAISAR